MYGEIIHCDIGYCFADPSGAFAYEPPRTVFSTREKPLGKRAIQNCPAVNALERQLVEIPSPIGIRLELEEDADGPALSVIEHGTFAQPDAIAEAVWLEPPERWRDPRRPVLRVRLPYFFVTDAPCFASLLPPFLSPAMRRWPGTMVVARWPVAIWPQDLAVAIEWDRPDEQLTLRQGEPLAYALFEFNHPAKRPRLVEAALTDALAEYRQGMEGVRHLTGAVEQVWDSAAARRPQQLMVPLAEAHV